MEMRGRDLVLDLRNLKSFKKKAFRDAYVSGRVRTYIALQIRQLRQRSGLTQQKFAKKIGKGQTAVSRLESTEYGRVTVQTLLEIAEALDIAVVVRFASFAEFLSQHSDVSPPALAVETYSGTIKRVEQMIIAEPPPPDRGFEGLVTSGASATASMIRMPTTLDMPTTGRSLVDIRRVRVELSP